MRGKRAGDEPGIEYTLEVHDPNAHLFKLTVFVAKPEWPVHLWLPRWIPGSYLLREFARHIEQVRAFAGTTELDIQKSGVSEWRCDGPTNRFTSQHGALRVEYLVYAWDLSVRTAHLDHTHGFFNGTSVFMAVRGREDRRCLVNIRAPSSGSAQNWRLATTLKSVKERAGKLIPGESGFGWREAANYDELVDHPVEMGSFQSTHFSVGGCRHDVVISGRTSVDLSRLARDVRRICAAQIALFEPESRKAPVRHYLFLTTAVGQGYGGLEHRSSTALICSRHELPSPGNDSMPDDYVSYLGLVSHEYFHTWNVKRIKPAAFAPYDMERENLTRLLWIFEGFTSYYDDLMLRRAGLISETRYLEMLQKTIRGVLATPGHRHQTVAESSFDAWTKFYRPDENTPNAVVSYYTKGALVALCLDLTIRMKTRGRRSLDDVMRLMWSKYGRDFYGTNRRKGTGVGIDEDGFAALVSEATGLDMDRQIRQWAYSTQPLPLKSTFEQAGIIWSQVSTAGLRSTLGLRVTPRDGVMAITAVLRGGPAERAGLAAGDTLMAVDGLRVDERSLKRTEERCEPGTALRVHAFRRDELFETVLSPDPAPALVELAFAKGRHSLRESWLRLMDDGR